MLSIDFPDSNNAGTVTAPGIGATLVSGSFTPPPLSLVVVMAGAGWTGATAAAFTCSDTSSNTWANPIKAIGASTNGGGVSIFTSYFATSPGPITITVGYSGFASGSGGRLADFFVLQGAAASQSGAGTGSKISTSGVSGTFNITTVRNNSFIFGVSDDATNGALWTPSTGIIQDIQYNDTTDNITLATWYATVVPTAQTYTVGGSYATNGASNHTTQQCALEVMPAPDLPPRSLIVVQQARVSSYL